MLKVGFRYQKRINDKNEKMEWNVYCLILRHKCLRKNVITSLLTIQEPFFHEIVFFVQKIDVKYNTRLWYGEKSSSHSLETCKKNDGANIWFKGQK